MKIFVAGATGVLGCALIPLLIQKGYIIRTIARPPEKVRALEIAGVEAVQGDLLTPETAQQLPDIIKGCNVVIHIATAIPRNFNAPGAWDVNTRLRTEGTRLLLQAALTTGVQRYVQQSIVMAYPDGGERWLDESEPLETQQKRNTPVIAMEDIVRAIGSEQLQWTILRGGVFVGPGTAQDDVLRQLHAEQVIVPCDGRNFVSHVHVVDMAIAIVAALDSAPAGSIFNIVDEPIRNGEYLDRLADLTGAPRPLRAPSQQCPPSFRCSNHAARTILGWAPTRGIWAISHQNVS